MAYHKTTSSIKVDLLQTQAAWKIKVQYPKGKYTSWKVNGKSAKPTAEDGFEYIWVSGLKNVVEVH
jgi:hypothetical protein